MGLSHVFRPIVFLAFALVNLTVPVNVQAQTAPDRPGTGFSYIAPSPIPDEAQRRSIAASELREEEHQRILGMVPNFNTSEIQDAQPLSPEQKLSLAAKSNFDPFTFVASGLDAGLSQIQHAFPAYHEGTFGYLRRFGASYADGFNSINFGNALLPILFKQDPRYFRRGTGSFAGRLVFALMSAVKCKNDNGKWAPNYSNMLGNLAAGGMSNMYYPSANRGAGLTLERAADVTIEGAIGSVFFEFWPDVSRWYSSKHHSRP